MSEHGLEALNMRSVADRCSIALGSLYNYFASKRELTLAAIESVWHDIFRAAHPDKDSMSFPDTVQWFFTRVQAGMVEYPNFFTAHSLGFASTDKGLARKSMERCFSHMEAGLLEALRYDTSVRPDAFSGTFTDTAFVHFVFTGILSLLMQTNASCEIMLEVIRRTIY